jgi:5'-nucleotidase
MMTNDDGFRAEGLHLLHERVARWADVIVVAPESEQSGTSHSLSLHRPLRLRLVREGVYALDGTPADCVYFALNSGTRALPRSPDMVISGMNHGTNLGIDVFYSGTVGGAREGALRGIPSLATSADLAADRPAAAELASAVAQRLCEASAGMKDKLASPLGGDHDPMTFLFNLNVPAGAGPWPLRATVLGARLYEESVVSFTDPRGREYVWIGGKSYSHRLVAGSDTEAYDAGAASLTPLALELTASAMLSSAAEVVASLAGQHPAVLR